MGRLFGTDGVRGVAGIDLTAQLAMDLAVAAVTVLYPPRPGLMTLFARSRSSAATPGPRATS